MIQKKAIFNNLFSNHTITPQRLCNFGRYVCNALTNANKSGEYTAIVTELQAVLEALKDENFNVNTNLTIQVNATKKVEEFIEVFVEFMKDNEPFIARALGGRKSAAYRQFYPRTTAEYDNANKTSMELFTIRLHTAAAQYKEDLGEELAGKLQSFEEDYEAMRNEQLMQQAAVNSHRAKRNEYFAQAKWVLTAAVHYAAFINRSNQAASHSFFPFDMLYPKTRHKIKRLKGELNVLATGELPSFTLITTATITIKNVCDNAPLLVWIADRQKGIAAPDTAMMVEALGSKKLTADMLKDMAGKRVLVKNGSAINNAHYEIAITGLKKNQTIAMKKETEEEEEITETYDTMVIAS